MRIRPCLVAFGAAAVAVLFILLGLVTGCQVGKPGGQPRRGAKLVPPDLNSVTLLMGYQGRNPVKLVNGEFRGEQLRIHVLKGATADLNQDGLVDGVVTIFSDSGGAGNIRELCLLLNDGKEMVHTDKAFIGDRIRITNLQIDGGVITIDYLDREPEDPFAVKPHVKKRAQFRVRKTKLNRLAMPLR